MIYIIVKTTYPEGFATVARTYSYAKGFLENGIESLILIPIPMEPYSSKPHVTNWEGLYKGTRYRYMTKQSVRSKFFFRRAIEDYCGYFLTLLYIIFKMKKTDRIILYEGGYIWHRLVLWAAHIKGTKVVLELNELPYGTTIQNKRLEKKRKKYERLVMPKLDGVLAISHTLKEYADSFLSSSQSLIVPIIVSIAESKKIPIKHYQKYLFHSGTLLQQKDGILDILKAFGVLLKDNSIDLHYVFTGNLENSIDKEAIKTIIKEYSLDDNVHFTGYLEKEELTYLQEHAFATIIYKNDNIQNKYCFSTKLGEYLMSGCPVITTNVGEAMFYLEDRRNALIVPYGNQKALLDAIKLLIRDCDLRTQISSNGKLLCNKEFSSIYRTKCIINYLQEL